jgi:predicted DNA-binding mobile mystery protein A
MKDMDILRLQQLEDSLAPFREVLNSTPPKSGWADAVRAALGISKVALARRLLLKAPQTVEDMLASEAAGTIKLNTLRKLAEALECRLVYAIVPVKPLDEIRRERAVQVANKLLGPVSHTMKLEDQGITSRERQRTVERLVDKLLAGSPRKLWD